MSAPEVGVGTPAVPENVALPEFPPEGAPKTSVVPAPDDDDTTLGIIPDDDPEEGIEDCKVLAVDCTTFVVDCTTSVVDCTTSVDDKIAAVEESDIETIGCGERASKVYRRNDSEKRNDVPEDPPAASDN